ncbi:hypothetical protein OAJ57_02700 [Alphaproteobacteria bacterium]|nr:hypothetical protein [Alphaproteobacteria bacterium]
MALTIETFSNVKGGNSFYKAISHPLTARKAATLINRLAASGTVAVYDPYGLFSGFSEFHDFSTLVINHAFVQDIEQIGQMIAGCPAQPVTELRETEIDALLVAAFDAARLVDQIRHLMPRDVAVASFDDLRLDDALLTDRQTYLNRMNFATNFAFFRDVDGMHTRLATANYWSGYGAAQVVLYLILFADNGAILAEWDETLADGTASIQIDSRDVRERFGIGSFTGQLYIHAIGIAGHDVVKYSLDMWSDDGAELSCTHDANAWPADFYAGLPAPHVGEEVVLWIQNSHPCPIPEQSVALNVMGDSDCRWLPVAIPPYGTCRVAVSSLLPDATWPQQIEINAGKYFVRPRYEVCDTKQRRRIAHVNVERTDLKPDPTIAELGNLMGKGFILPAPILPPERWRSTALPTPMATCQEDLPVTALVIDATGREMMRHRFGRLARNHHAAMDIASLLDGGAALPSGYGHMELIYDFADGGSADGWLHGLFRYENKDNGHSTETSFGAHIFNTVLTYRDEPQSYVAQPPGLSTRLFLRLGRAPLDTICHLIYPASAPWHSESRTQIILLDGSGRQTAEREISIPCGGSRLWHYLETFTNDERARAGAQAFAVIRDKTCRLFGYHGLLSRDGAFSLDHMFGF